MSSGTLLDSVSTQRPCRGDERRAALPRWLQLSLAFLTIGLGAFVMLPFALISTRLTRSWSRSLARLQGKCILRICGVRLQVHGLQDIPSQPAVFISNHPSTLDLFILISLDLDARFFLSGHLRKLVPLGIVGEALGVFWTVPQDDPEQRRKIFQRADRILRDTGESVFLSPEGRRVPGGEVGAFNKGAFHLATSLARPIVPMFLRLPPEVDPGMGTGVGRGVVDVYFFPAIDTREWSLDEIVQHKEVVRSAYLRWQEELSP